MKIIAKIFRWTIIVLATLSVIGYLLGVAVGSDQNPGQEWVALGWMVVGAIALYFELKSENQQKKH